MSEHSKIEWTDAIWPVVAGCTKVSTGCDNCYAIRDSRRLGQNPNQKVRAAYQGTAAMRNGRLNWTGVVRCLPERLDWPLRWKKPRRIFVCNESDLFHDGVPDNFIDNVWAVMMLATQHTFQVLTKRPARMLAYLCARTRYSKILECVNLFRCDRQKLGGIPVSQPGTFQPWIWLGVSVEDQQTANERIPLLLQTPAAVQFVSYEPALGPINFRPWTDFYSLGEKKARKEWCSDDPAWARLDWIIAGGESGPGARPSHPNWFRSVRDQCQAAGVPFFFKQWGEWAPFHSGPMRELVGKQDVWLKTGGGHRIVDVGGYCMAHFGKKAAGRLLDGREWNEFPKVMAP